MQLPETILRYDFVLQLPTASVLENHANVQDTKLGVVNMIKIHFAFMMTLACLIGCTSGDVTRSGEPSVVGSDRDDNGCIGSAGYRWCARTQTCERPWEIADKMGFSNTLDEFKAYCGG